MWGALHWLVVFIMDSNPYWLLQSINLIVCCRIFVLSEYQTRGKKVQRECHNRWQTTPEKGIQKRTVCTTEFQLHAIRFDSPTKGMLPYLGIQWFTPRKHFCREIWSFQMSQILTYLIYLFILILINSYFDLLPLILLFKAFRWCQMIFFFSFSLLFEFLKLIASVLDFWKAWTFGQYSTK